MVEPGLVRIQGVWARELDAVIITRDLLSFVSVRPEEQEPISFAGGGSASVLDWRGPITTALFGMGPTQQTRGAGRKPVKPPFVPE